MPPTIVFDIGNVLVRWDPRFLLRKVLADEADIERFLATACSVDWLRAVDAGSISPAIPARVREYPHYEAALRAFDERWMETLGGPIAENVALFARLKAMGRKVYGISNYPLDKFEQSRPVFPFYDWFDGLIVSGREGVSKPDAAIFRLLLSRYGLDPRELLFIDDALPNVETARSLGIATIHYGPGIDLAAEFARRGVLP